MHLPLEDDPMLPHGLAEYNLVRMSSSAMEVVDLNRRVVGRLPPGEHSTGRFPTTAVDPLAAKAIQGPNQRKYDRVL